MSKFVHIDYSTRHAGVERVENAVSYLRSRAWAADGARLQAGALVSAIVAALLVVANELIDAMTDGHLLAAWIGLWAIGFAAMALLARPARRGWAELKRVWRVQQEARQAAARDRQFWESALHDHRLMDEIRAAMARVGG